MKYTSITVAMMCCLASPVSVLAEEQAPAINEQPVTTEVQAVSNSTSNADVPGTEAATLTDSATSGSMHEMGMMHKGKGQHGKGDCGMKHGGGQGGKGMQAKHDQVVQRLDMIEARLAKIEAMLESLMRR